MHIHQPPPPVVKLSTPRTLKNLVVVHYEVVGVSIFGAEGFQSWGKVSLRYMRGILRRQGPRVQGRLGF